MSRILSACDELDLFVTEVIEDQPEIAAKATAKEVRVSPVVDDDAALLLLMAA